MTNRFKLGIEAAAKAATQTIFTTDVGGFKYMRPDIEVRAVRRAVDAINAIPLPDDTPAGEVVERAVSGGDARDKLLTELIAARSAATRLTRALQHDDWKPSRAHIEGARNDILDLVIAAEDALAASPAPVADTKKVATEDQAQRGLNDTWPGDPYP